MFLSCFCLCLKTRSPCYKHILKNLGEMSQIHYHACSLSTQIEKKKKQPDFIITYCCLITLWIPRHTHAKRRWVKSSSARLRDGEFQGQWCSRKILLAPLIEKWNHAISEHHHKAKERWTPPNPGRWGRGTPQEEGQTQHPGMEQTSITGSTSKGPREPLGHHLRTSSQAKLPLSDHNPDLGCRLWIQSTRDFIHWVPFRWGMHNIYCTEKKTDSLLLLHAVPFLQWGCTQPNRVTSLTGTSSQLDTLCIIIGLCSLPSVILQPELHCSSQEKFKLVFRKCFPSIW